MTPSVEEAHWALEQAVGAARWSGCQKSKRGVVIWRPGNRSVLASGWNTPPHNQCDGSAHCRASCGKICIHAEQYAILEAATYGKPMRGCEMLHVKVVAGQAVPSGGPSCPHCSKLLSAAGISGMWLLHEKEDEPDQLVLRRYTTEEFHLLTLENLSLHPYQPPPPISVPPPSGPPVGDPSQSGPRSQTHEE